MQKQVRVRISNSQVSESMVSLVVNRDEAFSEYFSAEGSIFYEVSQYALYTISYIEIVLGHALSLYFLEKPIPRNQE